MSDDVEDRFRASLDRLDRLLERWNRGAATRPSLPLRGGIHPTNLLAVWALASQVYRQAELTRPLFESHGVEIGPLIRSQFECSVTAQWLVLRGPKALPGFLSEGARQRLNLGQSALSAKWPSATAELVDSLRDERLPRGDLDEHAKSFEKLAGDFQGGSSLYTVYRFLSGLSHPGLMLVDSYVHKDPQAPNGFSLRNNPRSLNRDSLAWTSVWSLVWAGRAVDWLTMKSPDRFFLKKTAREADMPSDMLVLTEKAAAKAYADGYDAGRRSSAAAEDPAD